LRDEADRMVAGFRTINGSVAGTLELFECKGVNGPIYDFVSIVCNDAVGNGLVLLYQLQLGIVFMALIGMFLNLFILSRHPAEAVEPENGGAGTVTVNLAGGGQHSNPIIGYETGYPEEHQPLP